MDCNSQLLNSPTLYSKGDYMGSMIGIQFDGAEVTMAQYAGGTLRCYTERLPENLIQNDQIVSQETFAAFLKGVKRKGGFTGFACSVVLPFSGAYFRTLSMPVMTEEQLRINLPYEFRDFIGTESFRYNFDYAFDGFEDNETGEHQTMNLMAAAAPKETLDRYAQTFKKAGLRLKVAIPTEMALVNIARSAIQNGAELDREECICSIGYDHTVFSILREGKLAAFKIIDIGSAQIDDAIAELYNIDRHLAADYRSSNYESVLDSETCHKVYDKLGLEIMKTINFYRYENADSDASHITFIGDCEWLGDRLDNAVGYVDFENRSITDWLLTGVADEALCAHCALAIGAVSRYE